MPQLEQRSEPTATLYASHPTPFDPHLLIEGNIAGCPMVLSCNFGTAALATRCNCWQSAATIPI
jgi:hypothetical protein